MIHMITHDNLVCISVFPKQVFSKLSILSAENHLWFLYTGLYFITIDLKVSIWKTLAVVQYSTADCITVSTVGGEIIAVKVKPVIRRTVIPIQPLVYIIS